MQLLNFEYDLCENKPQSHHLLVRGQNFPTNGTSLCVAIRALVKVEHKSKPVKSEILLRVNESVLIDKYTPSLRFW